MGDHETGLSAKGPRRHHVLLSDRERAPAVTVMRPVESIGSQTNRHYCAGCGRKKNACECDGGPRPWR